MFDFIDDDKNLIYSFGTIEELFVFVKENYPLYYKFICEEYCTSSDYNGNDYGTALYEAIKEQNEV